MSKPYYVDVLIWFGAGGRNKRELRDGAQQFAEFDTEDEAREFLNLCKGAPELLAAARPNPFRAFVDLADVLIAEDENHAGVQKELRAK